ncbi:MAG: hypothetical protein HRU12_23140 [Phaeodactylibacter sp.]|nr:hypothetical protein [Phaeodactylibacter sp.]
MSVYTTIYNECNNNPRNIDGVVTSILPNRVNGHHSYNVKWDNGYMNSSYRWGRDIERSPRDNTVVLCSTSYQLCADLDEEDKEIIKNKLNLLETALSN